MNGCAIEVVRVRSQAMRPYLDLTIEFNGRMFKAAAFPSPSKTGATVSLWKEVFEGVSFEGSKLSLDECGLGRFTAGIATAIRNASEAFGEVVRTELE